MSKEVPERSKFAVDMQMSSRDRTDLMQLSHQPGFGVLLRMMEVQCIAQDAALMQVDPSDERKVLAEHRVAVAKWEFFTKIKEQIEYQVRELVGERDKPAEPSDEDKLIDRTLNP